MLRNSNNRKVARFILNSIVLMVKTKKKNLARNYNNIYYYTYDDEKLIDMFIFLIRNKTLMLHAIRVFFIATP